VYDKRGHVGGRGKGLTPGRYLAGITRGPGVVIPHRCRKHDSGSGGFGVGKNVGRRDTTVRGETAVCRCTRLRAGGVNPVPSSILRRSRNCLMTSPTTRGGAEGGGGGETTGRKETRARAKRAECDRRDREVSSVVNAHLLRGDGKRPIYARDIKVDDETVTRK